MYKDKEKQLEWNEAIDLIHKLINDEKYVLALFITIGIYTGFKCKKILSLRWDEILNLDTIDENGVKLIISEDYHKIVYYIYKLLNCPPKFSHALVSQKKTVFSTQRLNVLLKEINILYKLKIYEFTTHTLRKTFGRKILESSVNSFALLRTLQYYFHHSSPAITLDYLSIDELPDKFYTTVSIPYEHYFDDFEIDNVKKEMKKNDKGYVYIIKDENYPEIYKIGKSKTPLLREKTLFHQSPCISLFKLVKTGNMSELEKHIHQELKDKRIRGEWFKLTDEEIKKIIEEYNFEDKYGI